MAGQYGYIYGKQSGSGLGKSDDVNKVLVIQPFTFDQLAFYGSNHRDASTNRESSDLCENPEYLPQTYHNGGQRYKRNLENPWRARILRLGVVAESPDF